MDKKISKIITKIEKECNTAYEQRGKYKCDSKSWRYYDGLFCGLQKSLLILKDNYLRN